MKLKEVSLVHVAVPLKKAIKHASHDRSTSDNLVVIACLENGMTGLGEGVPRPYVTGETIATAFKSLEGFDAAAHLGDPRDFPQVVDRLDKLVLPETAADDRGMAGNAARCALELALIDAYGKAFGRPAFEALAISAGDSRSVHDQPQRVRYSGVITADDPRKERLAAWKMRLYGFRHVKVKVGVPGQDDEARLASFRRILGRSVDIRLDANEAWHPQDVLERMKPLLRFIPGAIEQPVAHADVSELSRIRKQLVTPVMLDESLCGYPDAVRAIDQGLADLLNIRLSKCGGLLPSLRILRLAQQSELGVQLGCHPGETGILSAAGRHFASMARGLRYVEGSYDRHVLARNLVNEDLTFRYGGRARPLATPGLGISLDPAELEAMTVERKSLAYD